MFGIQPIHIVVIVLVALLIFGPRRLPEMGRSIGKAINEFRHSAKEMTDAFREEAAPAMGPQETNSISPARTSIPNPAPPVTNQNPTFVPSPAGIFCIQCGASNTAEAHFCSQCGTKLPEKKIDPSCQ